MIPLIRRFWPGTLERYIAREIAVPYLTSFVFLTSLFVSLVLKDAIGELLGKGVSLLRVLQYIWYLIAEKLTLTIPVAGLLGGIMASSRLSTDSEVTAMRASGISFFRIYKMFLLYGLFSGLLVAAVYFYYGPKAAEGREEFEDWLRTYHSLSLVQPGGFMGRGGFDGVSKKGQDIYAAERQGNILRQVQIREWQNDLDIKNTEYVHLRETSIPIGDGFMTRIIHADRGELLVRKNQEGHDEKFVRLYEGFILELNEKKTEYQFTDFQQGFLDYVFQPPNRTIGKLNVKPDNYTFLELFDFLYRIDTEGHEINTKALFEKVGQSGGQEGEMVRLPPIGEMQSMKTELEIWIMANQGKVNRPDGPSTQEYQDRMQQYAQFSAFLEDTARTRLRFAVEIHRRIAAPFVCIAFFAMAFPLGLVFKRGGKGSSFALAVLIYIGYFVVLSESLKAGYQDRLHPILAGWLPVMGAGLAAFWLLSNRTDDFPPSLFWKWLSSPLRPYFKPLADRYRMFRRELSSYLHRFLLSFRERLAQIGQKNRDKGIS